MVQFEDGAVKAQLGMPDMRLPIQYAFSYPHRLKASFPRLDFKMCTNLTFEQPDTTRFRNLALAYEALHKGGNMPCIVNAANEVVVAAFLRDEISFLGMSDVIEKTMEQAPVLATISAAVVKAKAASGAVKVGAKARMAAFRQNVESAEDRPISESEVMSADRSANEKNTVEPEVERNNDEIVVLKNDVLVADATPVTKKKPEKTASRKWGFGMGGGGLSMGADNLVPQYVTNSSVLKSENLMSLNSFDAEKKDPAKTDIHHKTPIGVGISISRYLNNRFSLQTGLTYSYLRSEWSTNNTYHIENDQRLHFIGIPLSLTYKIAEWNRFMFYASAGGMAEMNVAGKRRMKLFSDEVEIAKQSEHIRMKEWLWSVNARAGVSYPIIRFVSAFAEVGASYYFDNGSEIETIHSEKPFNMSLQFGFRFGF